MHWLRSWAPVLGSLLALLVIFVLFAIADSFQQRPTFVSLYNLRVIAGNTALIAVPAFGMTLIIIAAGIDLSAGTALTLCGTVLAVQLKQSVLSSGQPGFAAVVTTAVLLTILTGCLCGLLNGLIISLTRVVPFIVTLGTMTIFLGIGQILADESTVYPAKQNIPDWITYLCYTGSNADNYWTGGLKIPTSFVITAVLAVMMSLVLRYTVFGRNVFAIGSSESTARLCGIHVPITTLAIYALAGFFVAVGGLLYFANVKNGNPSDGTGKELEIIAAVVLGGGSLRGGRGSIFGTLIGAMIIAVIRSGCGQLEIPSTYTHIIIGVIIILAVIVDQLRHRSPAWLFDRLATMR